MNLDLINAELRTVAFMQQQEEIELTYQDFLDTMNAEHDMMMYACHSYDEDAIFYGEN
jgi:uncharacterized membrane protein YcgQ (UPF0703/DUF1980 family)